ncbi:MAG: DUF2637 domain-containing protein [Streptosporangiaceae bacterium]
MPDDSAGAKWSSRRTKILITCSIGAAAAVLSYDHGLTVTRWFGTEGRVAYLVPLLPDGLIGLSSAELYDAAKSGARRPVAAVTGLVLGIVVTIVMNVASGWHHGWGGRLLNALAPLALIIAVWVLEVGFRRGQDGPLLSLVPATCDHLVPATARPPEKAAALWRHIEACEGKTPTQREVGRRLGIHHATAGQLVKAGLNGDGHEH